MSSLLPGWLQPGSLTVFSGDDDGTERRRAEQPAFRQSQVPQPTQGYMRPSQSFAYPAQLQGSGAPAKDVEPDKIPSHFLTFPILSFTLGFGTGLYQSTSRASLVFMAENAHRSPDTVQGWYFYNKTKNYRVLLAGAKGGVKTGLKLSAWSLAFLFLDEAIGTARFSVSKYAQQLREERRRWRASKGLPGVGALGQNESPESFEETALETLQTSFDSLKAIATGGKNVIDTSPPMMELPLATYDTQADIRRNNGTSWGRDNPAGPTYSTRADIGQLEAPSASHDASQSTYSTQADIRRHIEMSQEAQDLPTATYSTQRDIQQLGELYDSDSAAHPLGPAPWWSERAWYLRQKEGGKWIDGFGAGSITALAAVLLYRIPAPGSVRAISLGAVAGSASGLMRDLQGWLTEAKASESQKEQAA